MNVNRQFESILESSDADIESILTDPESLPTLAPELAEVSTQIPMTNWHSTRASKSAVTVEEVTIFMEGSGDADSIILSSKMSVSKVDLSSIDEILEEIDGEDEAKVEDSSLPEYAPLIASNTNSSETTIPGGIIAILFMIIAFSLVVFIFKNAYKSNQPVFIYSSGQSS